MFVIISEQSCSLSVKAIQYLFAQIYIWIHIYIIQAAVGIIPRSFCNTQNEHIPRSHLQIEPRWESIL